MSIVHIITGLNNGGAEAVLYRLVTNDLKNKHIVISLMGMGKYGSMLQEKNIEVICLNMPQGKVTFSGVLKLWKVLRKYRTSIVQTWMYHADFIGGLVAKFSGVKKIYWNIRHSVLEKDLSSRSTIFIARLCAFLSGFLPDKIVCCAEKSKQVHLAIGYSSKKMLVIQNGYDLNEFLPDKNFRSSLRKELNIKENELLLGMVGRYDPLKDHSNLIRSLYLLKSKGVEFKLILVGLNLESSNANLMQEILSLGLDNNVILLGQRTDMPRIMNALDLHILSSCSEGFPNVLCEAMACGVPCVSTNVGDAKLIIESTGWVVPPKNSKKLFEALCLAVEEMKDEERWKQRKEAAVERVAQNFAIDSMVEKYNAVWRI